VTAALALATWYAAHGFDRRLPWRRADEPCERVALVEGLLAQTEARQVADCYEDVFLNVNTADDWLRLPLAERRARVAPLGLPRLKEMAVTSIAESCGGYSPESSVWPPPRCNAATLCKCDGIGPYTAGMLALLHGHEAAPVDCNVTRVGTRAAADGDAERWIACVIGDAMKLAPVELLEHAWPPGYAVICAVLDVGAGPCAIGAPECGRCPLASSCRSRGTPGEQLLIFT
jgi:A/G-specific adenine glycosylase